MLYKNFKMRTAVSFVLFRLTRDEDWERSGRSVDFAISRTKTPLNQRG